MPARSTRTALPASASAATAGAAPREHYHHGALREALIEATEALLAERGLEGFSLREVARRSGVSPAAPAHHFGSADGLLVAVATQAFQGLAAALEAGNRRGGANPVARLREQGVGYVAFARRHPGRFGLMFRSGLPHDEASHAAAHHAFALLERGVRDLYGVPADAPLAPHHEQALLSTWSVVHGFAHLALTGQVGMIAGPRAPDAYIAETVGPMLDQHLRGLLAAAPPAAPAAPTARPRGPAPASARKGRCAT